MPQFQNTNLKTKIRNQNMKEEILNQQIKNLKEENKKLKEKNKELEKENKQIEKILLELEELKEMIYKKNYKTRKKEKVKLKQKKSTNLTENPLNLNKNIAPKKQRTKSSYCRPIPKKEEITGIIEYPITHCPKCETTLTQIQEHICYREGLDDLEIALIQIKKVIQRKIQSGYCPNCKKRKSIVPIPKQQISINRNIKMLIVYLIVLRGLSYEETQEEIKNLYNIHVSNGLINLSLLQQATLLKPFYQEIIETLELEKACHYDESSWKVRDRSEGNYVWIKTGSKSNKIIFWFGKSRGKGVAERLRGNINSEHIHKQIGISDDYGAYRNLFETHALCWAHPNRKMRDLAESKVLKTEVQLHCQKTYEAFNNLYKKAEIYRQKFNNNKYLTIEQKEKDLQELEKEFEQITIPHDHDPDKLKAIKKSLFDRKKCYFVFMHHLDIPLDNNKAERSLRKIVLKRKKCFGSKTQQGADILSILYSVVFSIYRSNKPEDFFKHYKEALNLDEEI